MLFMEKASLGNCELSYKIFGECKVSLIIEMGLGATAGEWWHIAERLAEKYTVFLYERNKSTKTERMNYMIC